MPRIPVRPRGVLPSIATQIRAQLDITTYLRIMHEAALTGHLPVYSVDGQPTGTFQDIDEHQRLEIMKFMVNKVVPDLAREVITTTDPARTSIEAAENPRSLLELSTAQLLRIATGESAPPADSLESMPDRVG